MLAYMPQEVTENGQMGIGVAACLQPSLAVCETVSRQVKRRMIGGYRIGKVLKCLSLKSIYCQTCHQWDRV